MREIAGKKIQEAYDAISSINRDAYQDLFLISNPVLSKNALTTNFLHNFLNDKNPKQHSICITAFKLTTYYIKSMVHFALYLVKYFEYLLSFFRFNPSQNRKELILIDTFFLTEYIKKKEDFNDRYFPGLEGMLKKKNKHYAYLPVFSDFSNNKNILKLRTIFKILKRRKIPVICEYQLLSIHDFFHLLFFIIVYPVHVLNFSRKLKTDRRITNLIRYELIDTLDQVTFYNFSRHLQGKQIAKLPYESIKVISWYENLPIHKNLYKGLRAVNTGKVKIYGAQLFLRSRNYLYVIPDEEEEVFGLIPERIIVNGPYFMPEKSRLNYTVGPSLRYAKIFDNAPNKEKQKNILILLPYFKEDIENILRLFFTAEISSRKVLIKIHPAIPIKRYKHLIPPNAVIVDDDIYKLFETAKIVIGASSSVLLEAASLGIPVVLIRNTKRFEYGNTLPEYGKDIIWSAADTGEDLTHKIEIFEQALAKNSQEFNVIADRYRKMFFTEVTEASIANAFDL